MNQAILIAKIIAFQIFLLTGCGCIAADMQQKDLEVLLQKSFDQIHLAINGLEYPGSVSILNNCVKYNDKDCLRAYNRVLEGKKMIQSVSSMKALDTTLDLIEKDCTAKDQERANFTCVGAILSLYFYTTPEQDAKILNRMKIYPKKVKNIIFNNDFYWFYNRPDKDGWINAISAMDIDWQTKGGKQVLCDLFRKDIAEMKDETFIAR